MKKVKIIILLIFISLLVACGEGNSKDGQIEITLANWSQLIVEQTNLLVEEEKGFFEKEGIDLKLVPGNGGQDALKTMIAGHADIAFTDPGAVYSALAQGEDLVIIYTVYPQNVFNVVASKEAKISKIEDLKGKKVGIYSRASGTYQNLLVLLHEAGLSEEDVELIEVGIANFAPLIQGQVDATAATDTALVPAKREGLSDVEIFEVRDSLNIPSDFFVVKRSTYEEKQEELQAFIKAYEESARWMMNEPDEAAELAKEYAIDGRESEINREIIDLRNRASLDDEQQLGATDINMIQEGADAYYELGLISEKLDMENYIEEIKGD